MEPWDYIRFVYETESLVALGARAEFAVPGFEPSSPDFVDPGGASGKGTKPSGNRPAAPEELDGKDQEEAVMNGSYLLEPCWLINEYGGIDGTPLSDGEPFIYTGTAKTTRGPMDKMRITYGYGPHGDGIYPAVVQGYKIEALSETGAALCSAFGWTEKQCRAPGQGFPIGAPECGGVSIGGDNTPSDQNLADTMWQRFEDGCLKTLYPEC